MFALNVILTVKNPDDIDQVAEYLKQAGVLSRQEAGCISYEACHSQNDRSVFMLVERWSSKETWEAHRTQEAYLTIYQPKVIPLVDRVPHILDLL